MTASAAEVEAAQKAMGCEQWVSLYVAAARCRLHPDADGFLALWTDRGCPVAVAVADAVVAAAQPRIAADERCEVCGGGRVMMHNWVKHEDACVGLCEHGKDPSACPSGCTDDEAQS